MSATDPLVEVLNLHAPVGLHGRCYCTWKPDNWQTITCWAEGHAAYSKHLAEQIRDKWLDEQLEKLHRESFSDGHAQGYGEGRTDGRLDARRDVA